MASRACIDNDQSTRIPRSADDESTKSTTTRSNFNDELKENNFVVLPETMDPTCGFQLATNKKTEQIEFENNNEPHNKNMQESARTIHEEVKTRQICKLLLLHGPAIVQYLSVMPVGFLSEEASEARNKDFRRFRREHSRKRNATDTNTDILNNLLLSSDPVLTSLRPKFNKKPKKSLFSEFYQLTHLEDFPCEFVDINEFADDTDSDSSDDDDNE